MSPYGFLIIASTAFKSSTMVSIIGLSNPLGKRLYAVKEFLECSELVQKD
jgi:hypothetical protein